jgi:hypothetical protein
MVAAEIEYAYRHPSVRPSAHSTGAARSRRKAALPLSTYLDRIQYALWRDEADTEAVINSILSAIEGEAARP